MLNRPISIIIERHYDTSTQQYSGQTATASASHLQLPTNQRPATPPLSKPSTTQLNILPKQQTKSSINSVCLTPFFSREITANKSLNPQGTCLTLANPPRNLSN